MYDAIVVGGGIVGMASAYYLVRSGARTLLIDRGDTGRATDAGAGILAPETVSRDSEDWVNFAIPAVQLYQPLVKELGAAGAEDTGYSICGQLTLAISEDEDEAYRDAEKRVFERQQRRGTPSDADLYRVDSEQARAFFPALGDIRGGFYFRNGARVDGRKMAAALRHAALQKGLEIRNAGVERLLIEGNTVVGVVVDGGAIHAGAVAITGGAWSEPFSLQLGLHVPIAPQRGQIIHLSLPGVDTSTWPVINCFRGHYMVPWPDSRVVVGATRENGVGFEPRTTVAGINSVLSEALRVAPGLADASIREIRVGLRPFLPDGLPVLGAVPNFERVFVGFGHGPTGLQLGPFSGKIIADLIGKRPIEADLSAMRAERFEPQTA